MSLFKIRLAHDESFAQLLCHSLSIEQVPLLVLPIVEHKTLKELLVLH